MSFDPTGMDEPAGPNGGMCTRRFRDHIQRPAIHRTKLGNQTAYTEVLTDHHEVREQNHRVEWRGGRGFHGWHCGHGIVVFLGTDSADS